MSFETWKIFVKAGANLISPGDYQQKAKKIKAIVFDWDGVFHSGKKNHNKESFFSEIDTMGVNMLRFGYYLMNDEIPKTFIISGEENKTCFYMAQREHYDAVFYKIKFKGEFADYLKQNYNINPEDVLFVFDDILDLQLAEKTGLNIMVRNTASLLLHDYCFNKKLIDYFTANSAEKNAVREICELTLSAIDKYNEAIEKRYKQDPKYIEYLNKRNSIDTLISNKL